MNSLLTLALAAGAFFHTALKSSIPAKGSVVHAPTRISLTFTEKVILAQSSISVLTSDSALVEKLVVKGTSDPATVEGAVIKHLAPGEYVVRWKTAADDGHVARNVFGFAVAAGQ
ncbi:MAG TPA: copper resistance CopC family protein [Gemmatimonadales bacterium]